MLKAILDNHVHHKQLRFYEWGRVWLSHNATNFSEQKSLTGIFFEESLDFYAGKSMVMKIYDELRCPIEWKPLQSHEYPWFSPYQAAELFHNNSKIGIAGMLNQNTINTLSSIGGTSFIFELNGDFLQNYRAPKPYFSPASKYPSVKRDISIFAPATLTAAAIINCIQNTDSRIKTVDLIDFFSQPEWKDQKAFTFHIDISDPEKTLEQADVDILWNTILTRLQTLGVSIR
jgi:phenylalanyl-tRNA synthetase beta chain